MLPTHVVPFPRHVHVIKITTQPQYTNSLNTGFVTYTLDEVTPVWLHQDYTIKYTRFNSSIQPYSFLSIFEI